MPAIDSFRGEYRFLSNFYMHPVMYEDILYPSSEHAYQAAKTRSLEEKKYIASMTTPKEAKNYGRQITNLREDWENVKIWVMEEILEIKFSDWNLRNKLLKTLPAELIEGNTWGDDFWGVCEGKGRNELGKLLMKIRNKIDDPYGGPDSDPDYFVG